jgi:hypothetical protein
LHLKPYHRVTYARTCPDRVVLRMCETFLSCSSMRAFSFFLSKNSDAGSSPCDGRPIMHTIKSISMDIGLSSHMYPLCIQLRNIFMHVLISWLRPKCGMSNRFRRSPSLCNPLAHTYGSIMIMWVSELMNDHIFQTVHPFSAKFEGDMH